VETEALWLSNWAPVAMLVGILPKYDPVNHITHAYAVRLISMRLRNVLISAEEDARGG
jgi:hypothetical protein